MEHDNEARKCELQLDSFPTCPCHAKLRNALLYYLALIGFYKANQSLHKMHPPLRHSVFQFQVNLQYEPIAITMPTVKKSQTTKATRRVRFAEHSMLIVTRPKSARDLRAAWYTKKEMKQFDLNARVSTRSILDRSPAAANAYIEQTFRGPNDFKNAEQIVGVEHICGIEHGLNQQVCRALLTARSKVINDVMKEQSRQKTAGQHNPNMVAAVSKRDSLFPKLWRQRVAVLNYSAA